MPERNSLGKGLGALLPDLLQEVSVKPAYIMCGIEELSPNKFQSRKEFNDEEQKRLVSSIKKSGILQPIVARRIEGGYEIIAGERRWRAAQEAGLKEVPIIVREAEDAEAAELSLIENVQREDLNPLEEAHAYHTLMHSFGYSQEELSLRVGKDRSTIANTLRLLKLPAEVKRALIDKTISQGHARTILMVESKEDQLQLLDMIVKKSLSVREAEKLAKKMVRPFRKRMKEEKDPFLRTLEYDLSRHLMTEVKIHQRKAKGSIEIFFSSSEELDRLVSLLKDRGREKW